MQKSPRLQIGGTVDPSQHIYIQRAQDVEVLNALLEREFCNILSPRQMGKSSLMAWASLELSRRGVRSASVDIAGELGSPRAAEDWYRNLLEALARKLSLPLDLDAWWGSTRQDTLNQRLLRFFREELGRADQRPTVVFLDEIDATGKLPYTDDLFAALRTMHNDRPVVESFQLITVCLSGVAAPNELIKDPRTTPYNIGRLSELRDFDQDRDDLSSLCSYMSSRPEVGRLLLQRILYWTGGQPYLTIRACDDVKRSGIASMPEVDSYVKGTFADLHQLSQDPHFQQILRYFDSRLLDDAGAIEAYERIQHRERDEATSTHAHLKLSGLVKRDSGGFLAVRNRIYRDLFDARWVATVKPRFSSRGRVRSTEQLWRTVALASSLTALVGAAGWMWSIQQTRQQPMYVSLTDVSTASSSLRDSDTMTPVRVPRGTERFVLVLQAEELSETCAGYSLVISDAASRELARIPNVTLDENGFTSLLLSRRFLPEGDYRIVLFGRDSGGEEVRIATYDVPIEYL